MFEDIMIHSTSVSDGMASMDEVNKLVVSPGADIVFAPMGTHLMLMDAVSSISLGQLIPVTLHLSDGSSKQVIFEVRHDGGGKR